MIPTRIPYLKNLNIRESSTIVDQLIQQGCEIRIDQVNWSEYSHCPTVTAYLGYCDTYLWIHYVVNNDFFKAVYRNDQEPVWQDSCVEFFLKQGSQYRNFELKSGDEFSGNLYKCGDKTKIPHYLSWHPIDTINPDFHQPHYFGLFKLIR